MTLRLCLLVVVMSVVRAQTSLVPFEDLVQNLRDDAATPNITATARKAAFAQSIRANLQNFALYALGSSVYASLVEEGRLDKQVGASASGTGSTSLVSHGSVPSLIGLAVESGALYQSVSGTVVTFRLNPSGLVRALANNSYLASGPVINATVLEKAISRVSASASFDFQKGSSPGTFTAERSQLKEAALRYDIFNKRDPRHPSHAASIQALSGQMAPLVNAMGGYAFALAQSPDYSAWVVDAAARLDVVDLQDETALRNVLVQLGDEFKTRFAGQPEPHRLGAVIVDSIKSYRTIRDQVFKQIQKSSVLTFEYAFNKLTPPGNAVSPLPAGTVLPDLSTARLIFSSPLGSVGEATLNGSVTFFNSTLPQMRGNFRDFQASGSLDFRLPEIQGVGKPVLTFAGLGAVLHQQPFGVKVKLQDVETADGVIGVFQSKLTFPAGSSGVRIPVSLTIANRSEFNTEKEVRGSIGVSFDLDQLFAR